MAEFLSCKVEGKPMMLEVTKIHFWDSPKFRLFFRDLNHICCKAFILVHLVYYGALIACYLLGI